MTRYVPIKEPVVLTGEDDEPIKEHTRTTDPLDARRCQTGSCSCPPAPGVTMYRWFITNCTYVAGAVNPQTGQQTRVGPGKAFGDGDKAARAIAHIKRALKNAEPGTYAEIEHADWVLWKKCCEEADWNPVVSSQYIGFIDAVLDAKDTAPKPVVVPEQKQIAEVPDGAPRLPPNAA